MLQPSLTIGIKGMKVVILAGGFGTRLAEYSDVVPKPMVTLGGRPIIWHIMKIYAKYGHKDFFLALGYKAGVIKQYFLNHRTLNADFTVDLFNGNVVLHQTDDIDWRVTLVDTGLESMTGGRLRRMKKYIREPFLMTYGDGVADIDLDALVEFHRSHGKMVTVSAVRPVARFGELTIEHNQVTSFKEKPQAHEGWINGGFFVIEPAFLDLIESDDTVLEGAPLERAAAMGELMAYAHTGFWQCMDTKRDRDSLESMWASGKAPWKV
jgi:glucose-1-phosphate cytidylyltransferase